MNDRHLIQACQEGDRTAFRTLFDTYKDQVHSIALNFCADQSMAQDITQEVFVKLFQTVDQFRHQASFTTWLYRIVVNTCLNEQRRRKRFVPFISALRQPAPETQACPETNYKRRQMTQAVQSAVAALKADLRIPLLLRYMEGLSYAEISEVLDWPIGTVSSRLNRAHKILGKKLSCFRGELERK